MDSCFISRLCCRQQAVKQQRRQQQRKRDLEINIWEMVTILWYCFFLASFIVDTARCKWTGGSAVEENIGNERFTVVFSRCRLNLKSGNFKLSFGRLCQRIGLKCVPHVQHDYFSSFNQSDHCFLASSLCSHRLCLSSLMPRGICRNRHKLAPHNKRGNKGNRTEKLYKPHRQIVRCPKLFCPSDLAFPQETWPQLEPAEIDHGRSIRQTDKQKGRNKKRWWNDFHHTRAWNEVMTGALSTGKGTIEKKRKEKKHPWEFQVGMEPSTSLTKVECFNTLHVTKCPAKFKRIYHLTLGLVFACVVVVVVVFVAFV